MLALKTRRSVRQAITARQALPFKPRALQEITGMINVFSYSFFVRATLPLVLLVFPDVLCLWDVFRCIVFRLCVLYDGADLLCAVEICHV